MFEFFMSEFDDEKLVLTSAFLDQLKWTDDRRCIVDLETFQLILDFPMDYPNCPPFFSVHGVAKHKLPIDLDKIMLSLFVPGQVVAFDWIQYLMGLDLSIDEADPSFAESLVKDDLPEETIDLPLGCPTIYHSSHPLIDKKSVFIAHCASVSSLDEIDLVENHLKSDKKISKATHNITAYRIIDLGSQKVREEYNDDGEVAAGKRLLHMLQSAECINVYIMVSRW